MLKGLGSILKFKGIVFRLDLFFSFLLVNEINDDVNQTDEETNGSHAHLNGLKEKLRLGSGVGLEQRHSIEGGEERLLKVITEDRGGHGVSRTGGSENTRVWTDEERGIEGDQRC